MGPLSRIHALTSAAANSRRQRPWPVLRGLVVAIDMAGAGAAFAAEPGLARAEQLVRDDE
jgi:hypothetical protein